MDDIAILHKAMSKKHPCDECHKALDHIAARVAEMDDMAMLIRKLVHSLRKAAPEPPQHAHTKISTTPPR